MRVNYISAIALASAALSVALPSPAHAQFFGQQEQATQAQQVEAQLNMRINQLEGLIRQQNGMIEQYENRIRRLEDGQKRFQEDVDFRFKDLESAKAGAAGGAAKPAKKTEDASATAPAAPITQAPAAPQASPEAAAALAAMAAKDGGGMAPITAPPSSAPQDAYDLAYGFLLRKDYDQAEAGFRDFLAKNPKDKRAANAQYYIGEAQYDRKKYKESADSYLKAYQTYPNGAKVTDSLLKLGMSLNKLGAKTEACGTYSEVLRKYPNASSAIKKKLSAEQKAAGCGG